VEAKTMKRKAALVPVILFIGLAGVLWKGLDSNPSYIPSVLIGKAAPSFALPHIEGLYLPGLATRDLQKGEVTVVNIWASWCVPCRTEAPVLLQLAKRVDIRLVGIASKDQPPNAKMFLQEFGNPYSAIGDDSNGRATIDWGVYGVPETFILDGSGIIRHKVIGGLTLDMLKTELPSEIEKAKNPL
jgi:cytochrome c biogenesis protein CcmG, thiol:disulfide interchange protein DsbE